MEVSFISLNDNIDTTTNTDKFIFHLVAVLAEFELELIRERTNAGLKVSRARGEIVGVQQG
jgi:DNA invertase Pin-like site-specific DNA recombinase